MIWCICRFHTDIPDEFLFTSSACLDQLAIAVQLGHLTEEQKRQFEDSTAGRSNTSENNAPTTEMIQIKQPCCPWFTCCL